MPAYLLPSDEEVSSWLGEPHLQPSDVQPRVSAQLLPAAA